MSEAPIISKEVFIEILQNGDLVRREDLLVFQTIHSLTRQEASATQLAAVLGWPDFRTVISRVVGLGRRIRSRYSLPAMKRTDGTNTYWVFFFTGSYMGSQFMYRLRPELAAALAECGLLDKDKLRALPTTAAYLFAWNPDKWNWKDLLDDIGQVQTSGKVTVRWSCTSHRRIKPGDRVFMVRLGSEPRGIMASGRVASEPFTAPHWNGEDRQIWKVLLNLDVLLNPASEPILTLEHLGGGNLDGQVWTPMSSGVQIHPDAVGELEAEWFRFLTEQEGQSKPFAEEADWTQSFAEGASKQVIQTRYERNPYAREQCLAHHGYACKVCTFDFEQQYGSLGHGFIHVHHLTPVSMAKSPHRIDPKKDLMPVCPNCHAMLHRQNPPLTIAELKQLIKEA